MSVAIAETLSPSLRPLCAGATLARPKSRTFGVPSLGHKNIGGFDVAVNDAFSVSGIERVGNLESPSSSIWLERQRLTVNTVLQRLAIEKLHGNEMSRPSSSPIS